MSRSRDCGAGGFGVVNSPKLMVKRHLLLGAPMLLSVRELYRAQK